MDTVEAADAARISAAAIAYVRAAIMPGVIRAGTPLLPFTLFDSRDLPFSSSALLVRGPLVITLTRGSWCPYCVADLIALERRARDFAALGATLVALSPERAPRGDRLRAERGLSFPLLVDKGLHVARSLGLAYDLPADACALYRDVHHLDLGEINADGRWALPVTARVVVDAAGIVRHVAADPDHTRRTDPLVTLAVLRAIGAAAPARNVQRLTRP